MRVGKTKEKEGNTLYSKFVWAGGIVLHWISYRLSNLILPLPLHYGGPERSLNYSVSV